MGSKPQQFIQHVLVPICCSIALGFLFFQADVFNRSHGAFQFVWSGVVASLFYYLLIFLRPRDAYLGLLVLLGLTFLTAESTRIAFILRDVFYIGAIGASILAYLKYFRQRTKANFFHPAVSLGGIYGVLGVIASEIHLVIVRTFVRESIGGTVVGLATTMAFFGLMIGFAVGVGIGIADKIFGEAKGD